METYDKNLPKETKKVEGNENFATGRGHVWGGVIIVAIGLLFLADNVGVDFPRWLFRWPTFLIVLGFYLGVRHSFRSWTWLIPVFIGSAFLADQIFWDINIRPFIWPMLIVGFGLFMIFRPRRKKDWSRWQQHNASVSQEDENLLDVVSVFGGTKRNILSKDFKGGEVVTFFGGTELNLTQSDIVGVVVLEVTQVFGGTKLVVPSNWKIQSELVSVFGGVDDKRTVSATVDQTKTLVLKGTSLFGGLEIKSY